MSASVNSQNIKTDSLAQFEHHKNMDQKKTEDQEQTKEEFPENEIQHQDQFAVLDAAIE